MRNTPIHTNGPFKLDLTQGQWVISGRDGVTIVTLTAKLIDGSNRTEKYPDGFIRTEEARAEEALFVLEAMNARYERNFSTSVKV